VNVVVFFVRSKNKGEDHTTMCVISMVLAVWTGAAIMVMVVVMALCAAANGRRPWSCQSNKLRELRGEQYTPNDCPRIGDFDELLEALRLHHGPEGSPISNRFGAPQ
jgi:hypothetical protein